MLLKLKRFYSIIKERTSSQSLQFIINDSVPRNICDNEILPIVHGRIARKALRDFMLDEMSWMALDFSEERILKRKIALILAKEASNWVLFKTKNYTAFPEQGVFCNKVINEEVPIFGPPEPRDISIPLSSVNIDPQSNITINILSSRNNSFSNSYDNIPHDTSTFEESVVSPELNLIDNNDLHNFNNEKPKSLKEFLAHHSEDTLEFSGSSSTSNIQSITPPWSLLEDQIIIETCLQFNLNCNFKCAHESSDNRLFSIIVQHELTPPCNLTAEFLNSACHHDSFVRTPFSVLQRFHQLVLQNQKSVTKDDGISNKNFKFNSSKKILLEICQSSSRTHQLSQKQPMTSGILKPLYNLPSWKIKQWEKRMFIFGLIKKKVLTRGGAILSKEHSRPTTTISEKKLTKATTTPTSSTLTNFPLSTLKNTHLPYNLYLSAINAHPSHESAVKKSTVGIPKHLVSFTTSASDLALKRLQRVFHHLHQPNIGPVIISPIGGSFTGTIQSGPHKKK